MRRARAAAALACLAWGAAGAGGCFGYAAKHAIQWDARRQIHAADLSQVRVRNAQSRSFDAVSRVELLEAVVATLQDLDFQLELLDPELGIVSGKKFLPRRSRDVTYLLYDAEQLVVFSRSGVFRTWGPFRHRSDLVRLTVTVRGGEGDRLIVRAAAQHFLRPLENAEPYQKFFATLEKSLFVAREQAAAGRAQRAAGERSRTEQAAARQSRRLSSPSGGCTDGGSVSPSSRAHRDASRGSSSHT